MGVLCRVFKQRYILKQKIKDSKFTILFCANNYEELDGGVKSFCFFDMCDVFHQAKSYQVVGATCGRPQNEMQIFALSCIMMVQETMAI